MSEKRIFKFSHDQARRAAAEFCMSAPEGWVCRISEPTRSLEANALMWASLSEVSEQVVWHGRKLSSENWKDILTASLKKQEVVPGIDSGFVILGNSTSRMTKSEMSDLIDLIHAFGAEHGVKFSEPVC